MKQSIFFVLLVCLCAANIAKHIQEKKQFKEFINKYEKSYTPSEFNTRFQIFRENLEIIKRLNSLKGNATFGITKFSDLSREEFSKFYLTKPWTPEKHSVPKPQGVALPTSIDWRPRGAVTPVKNQEQCGSCWAFSTVENIESMNILARKATNRTIDLSVQQIVDCDQMDLGCGGGNPPTAYQYVIGAGGLEPSKDYPYTAQNGQCTFQKSKVVADIKSWKYATSEDDYDTLNKNLVSWGPLSICVDAANWQHYQSGVLGPWQCAWVNQLDHCVQLVGYQKQASTPYWIVRNSWGTSWGIQGYIWLEMGHNTCGLTNEATSSFV